MEQQDVYYDSAEYIETVSLDILNPEYRQCQFLSRTVHLFSGLWQQSEQNVHPLWQQEHRPQWKGEPGLVAGSEEFWEQGSMILDIVMSLNLR